VRKIEKPILTVLQGKVPEHRPVWLMRQAGRYLPEYREIRAKSKNFLNMCLTPELATQITLQPIRRFNMDAAILFADILLIPYALGVGLEFREGEGPVLDRLDHENGLAKLKYNSDMLMPVYETVRRVARELPATTTLIGFCGAPWTVACYMIDGNSKKDFAEAKIWLQKYPEKLDELMDILVEASFIYLSEQIKAGAEVLQIFDSWAGLISGDEFKRFVIKPTHKLVQKLKTHYPHIPLIGFPREAKDDYKTYIRDTGVDAMSIDQGVDINWAKRELQGIKPLQGNLSPDLLVVGGDAMMNQLQHIMQTMGPKHIINLGHGVVPQTPPEYVKMMVDYVHQYPVN
jgi:uroporphyrinogen decarboxylase